MTSLPPAGDQPRATDLPTSGPAFSPIGAIDGPPTERVSGPRRPGWLLPVAGLAGVLLVGALAVVVFLNLNPTAASDAARTGYAYLPANSLMAFEARLDMPAGQREQFFGFVSRFPGMGDAAQLEQRMNQLLNEAIGSATSGVANYSDDVEPWFSGWIVAGAQVRPGGELEESGEVVAVLGSTDRARAELGLERLRGRGSWVSQAGPNGTTIWTNAGGAAPASGAYAATDDAVVVGTDAAAVSAAIETRSAGSGSLLDDESFAASYARQPAGRLASFWLDYAAVQQIIEQQADDLPGMENPFEFTCAAFPMPVSMTGTLYMKDGSTVVEVAVEGAEGAPQPVIRDSTLAQRMPADTFIFFDWRDVGSGVSDALDCLRENPQLGEQLAEMERGIGQPLDQLIGWAGDTALGVRFDGSRASGGLVIKVTDQARAAEAMGQLRGLITAGGGQDVTVREEEYQGARMTVFELGGELGGELGEVAQPPAPRASFAYAFAGDLLILGVDAGFARAVLDTTAATSLNADAAYRRAIDAAGGSSNGGSAYIGVGRTMDLVDAAIEAYVGGGLDEQLAEMRSFVATLDGFAAVATTDGRTMITRLVLTTREP